MELTRTKLALLAEILKVSAVPANALLKLIRDYDVLPRWDDIPLPEGAKNFSWLPIRILCLRR